MSRQNWIIVAIVVVVVIVGYLALRPTGETTTGTTPPATTEQPAPAN